MQNNHASVIKGLNIAVIVLAVIVILACLAGFAIVGIGASTVNEYGYRVFDEALASHHELEREMAASGVIMTNSFTSADIVDSVVFGLALGAIGIAWEFIGAVVALVAGIMGVRGASKREKLGGVSVWGIVGAVVALLGGRIVTCVLLVISAVFANIDKRACAIPYGQPAAGQPYTQPMANQPYQQAAQPFPQSAQPTAYAGTYGAGAGQSVQQHPDTSSAENDSANAPR